MTPAIRAHIMERHSLWDGKLRYAKQYRTAKQHFGYTMEERRCDNVWVNSSYYPQYCASNIRVTKSQTPITPAIRTHIMERHSLSDGKLRYAKQYGTAKQHFGYTMEERRCDNVWVNSSYYPQYCASSSLRRIAIWNCKRAMWIHHGRKKMW